MGDHLVLHDAVRDSSFSLSEIKAILKEHPDSIREIDSRPHTCGFKNHKKSQPFLGLPLHAALECGRYDVAHFLLKEYPQAARTVVFGGNRAIDILFLNHELHPPYVLAKDVIDACPEVLKSPPEGGRFLPLFNGLQWIYSMVHNSQAQQEDDSKIVIAMFECFPDPAKECREVLEKAVMAGQALLIQKMVTAYPEILQDSRWVEREHNPLYWASLFGYTDIVRFLLESGVRKEALTTTSKTDYSTGDLPINAVTNRYRFSRAGHLSIHHIEVMKLLVQYAPETIMYRKNNGHGPLPIHDLAESGNSDIHLEIAKLLVEHGPNSMLFEPKSILDSKLPIHLAAAHAYTGNCEMVKLLAEAAPATLLEKTDERSDERLPIHVACSVKCLMYLAQKMPETLQVSAGSKGALDAGGIPLHQAVCDGRFRSIPDTDSSKKEANVCFGFLLSNSPLAAVDRHQQNILHVALHKGLHLVFFIQLLDELQRQDLLVGLCRGRDHFGNAPLHFSQYSGLDCLKAIVERCPPEELRQVLQAKNTKYGQSTALQKCLGNKDLWQVRKQSNGGTGMCYRAWTAKPPGDSLERIQLLVDTCPESLVIRDDKGRLPIQIAVAERLPAKVLHVLAMSTANMDLDTLEVVSRDDTKESLNTAFEYLSKFTGAWATHPGPETALGWVLSFFPFR